MQDTRVIAEDKIIRVVASICGQLLVFPSAEQAHHAQAVGKRNLEGIGTLFIGKVRRKHPIRDLAEAVSFFQQRAEHGGVAVKTIHPSKRLHIGCNRYSCGKHREG